MRRMIVLVLLQLALVMVPCSSTVKCGSYTLTSNRGKDLFVQTGGWTSEPIKSQEKLTKITVERKCLLFVDGTVYGPAEVPYTINKKVQHVQCCCESWNSPNERFLNRHIIAMVPNTWNDAMRGRCIPIDARLIQTFIVSTPEVVKKVCGSQGEGEKDCRSQTTFTLYNIERKNNGHYINNQASLKGYIVVRCQGLLPIHFQCIVGNPGCEEHRYKVCN